ALGDELPVLHGEVRQVKRAGERPDLARGLVRAESTDRDRAQLPRYSDGAWTGRRRGCSRGADEQRGTQSSDDRDDSDSSHASPSCDAFRVGSGSAAPAVEGREARILRFELPLGSSPRAPAGRPWISVGPGYPPKQALQTSPPILGKQLCDLVVDGGGGQALNPDSLSSSWVRFCGHAGLPRARFHDLRHAHATFMLLKGIHPKVVSERLGHASIGITLDLYSRVTHRLRRWGASPPRGGSRVRPERLPEDVGRA